MKLKKILKLALGTGAAVAAVKCLDPRLEISRYTVTNSKIPSEFSGFKIAQISDCHSMVLHELPEAIESEKPDMIACTGDLLDDNGDWRPAVKLIERLVEIAPVYIVTGNHDVWRGDWREIEQRLNAIGAVTLHNERIFLEANDRRIGLTGIDDPFVRTEKSIDKFIKDAIEETGNYDGYDILLFHRANLFDKIKDKGYDLVLSGHIHGGQIRIPGIGGVIAPKSGWGAEGKMLFPEYSGGEYKAGGATMIVSRGLANTIFLPRMFNRPELVMVTLEHQDDEHCIDLEK